MIIIKTNAEIELIRQSSLLVSATLSEVAAFLKPGITTLEIDKMADDYIRDNGAVPSFKNYKGYPFATCISVNDAVVHGFPANTFLSREISFLLMWVFTRTGFMVTVLTPLPLVKWLLKP
jgi:methionyl aminopeptidase